MTKFLITASIAFGVVASMHTAAIAQQPLTAIITNDPQTAKFDGTTSLNFPGEESLNLTDVSTIEFWVKPTWSKLGYDPVLLSAMGDEKARYAIVMGADRKSIGLLSGDDWDYVDFDFDDGKSHHVAFVNLGDLTDVYIDGEPVDSITQPIAELPVRTFHIGSANGVNNLFVGQLSEIRLWDIALDGDDIAANMRVHILSPEGLKHPDLDSLVGVSDFANNRRSFSLLNNVSTHAELLEDLALARGGEAFPTKEEAVILDDGTIVEPLTAEELALFEPDATTAEAAEQPK